MGPGGGGGGYPHSHTGAIRVSEASTKGKHMYH